ncbi:MAG: D-tyrosyl-tRNA(Tyr) deacylase [Ignavibacteriales bacterium]|jgi:D-tyrosyl-tRNA(Tyr) deacylase|nr:MAG: D-tyrosyl-tRNA(Tyr) deacylase [Ignavibacteriaceae bacterium]MBW7871897.1 D-tyrosyl-tRNA(Tyr) deacylase [Ignavibacteria bacterium]MCZ2144253.1 D-tyrosyl-tRNA(Tyr) deacylase [Ignavibacteriales bacterium]OQY69617.1 MAG: D-tyrosyl-tRNA(Tyr) deacylase [Ignavibacteriales bacterium UTCHB3]MBV6446206.1 D-aminoacyl-tRNA deacylase [Ignavibacteriaceae bacterium]
MRALVQRVNRGSVTIQDPEYFAKIGHGMVILLGVKEGDTEQDVIFTADKCANLRIFNDAEGKMNISVKDTGGEVLVISQFTLYGETARGNRPGFTLAAKPETANHLYEKFTERMILNLGADKVKTGVFQAMMSVEIINDGPVTLMVESK